MSEKYIQRLKEKMDSEHPLTESGLFFEATYLRKRINALERHYGSDSGIPFEKLYALADEILEELRRSTREDGLDRDLFLEKMVETKELLDLCGSSLVKQIPPSVE